MLLQKTAVFNKSVLFTAFSKNVKHRFFKRRQALGCVFDKLTAPTA